MKIKGHTTIILKDVKTGKVERHEDENMITNAISEYFRNMGLVNYPDIDKNNLVPLLLGGIMAFDGEISEDASIIHVPAGLNMIANGSIGTVNNSEVVELGSYSTTESGWQNDGSFVQTYDYTTSQANGTIACVCLTSQNYGKVGEGNSLSNVRLSPLVDIRSLAGSPTQYCSGIPGVLFNLNPSDSSVYSFNIEEVIVNDETVKKGFIRKYRLPFTKLNLKQTPSTPIKLSETSVSLSEELIDTNGSYLFQPLGNNLLLWNFNTDRNTTWGNGFTQYLWTVTPSGTISQTTVVNATGDSELIGLEVVYFDGNYGFFPKTYVDSSAVRVTTTTIYVWNLSNNSMSAIENPNGHTNTLVPQDPRQRIWNVGWDLFRGGTNDGRIITTGGENYSGFVVDAVLKKAFVNNALPVGYGITYSMYRLIRNVIAFRGQFYRDPTYIASINNLDTPVVKTSEKTMKIIYRLTFED